MPELYSVAIDGPSGAGKSTLAKAAAAALGICYVDTGAIYRTIGYGVYCRGIDPSDAAAVAAVLPEMRLELHYDQAGLQRMKLAGRDVTEEIRLPEMSKYASKVSAIPAVRDFLLELQRDQARRRSVIMDDLIATGGTMMAGKKLLEKLGATVTEGAAIVDLPELGGSARLRASGLPLYTLVDFDGH